MALRPVYIYGLCEPDTQEVRYIGKAFDPQHRLLTHLHPHALRPHTHKTAWLRELLARGLRPGLLILAATDTENWQEAERAQIAVHRAAGARLTNGTAGGAGGRGAVRSAETRQKLAIKARQRGLPPTFRENGRLAAIGRHPSAETRAKRSASLKGRKMSPEAVRKSVETRRAKGYILTPARAEHWAKARLTSQTPEAKARRADALRGRKRPAEVMEKVAAKKRGRPLTPEHREKLRLAHLGTPHPHSEAACRNIGRAQRGRAVQRNNSSGYKGVSLHRRTSKWQAYITLEGKRRHLGVYTSAEQAARAYNEAAVGLFGPYARLNEIDE